MSRFKRLVAENIDSGVAEVVSQRYHTVEAFLVSPDLFSAAPGALQQDGPGFHDVRAAVRELLASRLAPAPVPGGQLLAALRETLKLLPTGQDGLDGLLRGGFRECQLTELVGESAAGKTQLCLLAAGTTASCGERVLYIDTTNSFSAARMLALSATSRLQNGAAAAAGGGVAGAADGARQQLTAVEAATLSNVAVVRPHCIFALLAALDELCAQLSSRDGGAAAGTASEEAASAVAAAGADATAAAGEAGGRAGGGHPAAAAAAAAAAAVPQSAPKLLVVDSISALISPILGGLQHSQGHTLMAAAARGLKQVADALQCAVLVTNHVVAAGSGGGGGGGEAAAGSSTAGSSSSSGGGGGAVRPALGDWWRGQPHVRVQLTHHGGSLRCASLAASTISACGAQAWLSIEEHGIMDAAGPQLRPGARPLY